MTALDTQTRPAAGVEPGAGAPRRSAAWRNDILTVLAIVWLAGWALLAVLADVLPIPDPTLNVAPSRLTPFSDGPLLGTDGLGRDVLSRLIYGARTSLAVGLAAAAIAMVVGGLIGLLAGYLGRATDAVVGTLTDIMLSFPGLVLLLTLAAVLEPSVITLVIGLSLISVPTFVRLARANTLRVRESEYVVAARMLGARSPRVLFRELLPNIVQPVLAYTLLVVATLIIAESSVSYLGLGIPPPEPSWGSMIADGQKELRTDPHLVAVPAITLFLTVFALNIVGEVVNERLNGGHRRLGRASRGRRRPRTRA